MIPTDEEAFAALRTLRAWLGLGSSPASSPPVFYVTGGASPSLPPGYGNRRVLEDACRAGELRGVRVPRSGWRFSSEDLAAWEASRVRERPGRRAKLAVVPANDAHAASTSTSAATATDHDLLAAAGGRRGGRR